MLMFALKLIQTFLLGRHVPSDIFLYVTQHNMNYGVFLGVVMLIEEKNQKKNSGVFL